MVLVLTNDDGIDAPGLAALRQAAGNGAVVAAPAHAHSGCGHQVTVHKPLEVHQREEGVFAIEGTPVDCTRLALTHLCPDATYVLSGINAGGNLGADVYISGTVAAAREAAFLGLPGIAVSHYKKGGLAIDWEQAARWTRRVLAEIFEKPIIRRTYWSVNLPHLEPGADEPQLVWCDVCTRPLPVAYRVEGGAYHYQGVYADRERTPGSDVDHCFGGRIAISELRL